VPEHPILCILSNPRSGSTALRRALAAGGRIKDFGEIFHDERELTISPFLNFLERWPDPLLSVFKWSECVRMSRVYIEQLIFESYGQKALIDVKHNAWGVLRPLWQYPHDEPVFMTALKTRRALFLQLKRESMADQVVSYIIANNTNVWHRQITNSEIPKSLIGKRLDSVLVRRLCTLFCRAEALTEELLADYPHRLTLSYETTFIDGTLAAHVADRLSIASGVEIRPVVPVQRPNAVDKREVISNYDEVVEIADAVRAAQTARQADST
jgi:LPS sulfotransferase NodH